MLALIFSLLFIVLVIILGIALYHGKCMNFISGYNTMSKDEKNLYDNKKLGKFVGKLVIFDGILLFFVIIGGVLDYPIMTIITSILILASIIIATIYANTGSKFQKK